MAHRTVMMGTVTGGGQIPASGQKPSKSELVTRAVILHGVQITEAPASI